MRLLFDTHAFLWWVSDDSQLTITARDAIGSPRNQLFLSAVTPWEIGIKVAVGKLESPTDYADLLADGSLVELPITIEHARAAGGLPLLHGDPFDRMLVAQATVEGLTIVSGDAAIAAYGVPTVWN